MSSMSLSEDRVPLDWLPKDSGPTKRLPENSWNRLMRCFATELYLRRLPVSACSSAPFSTRAHGWVQPSARFHLFAVDSYPTGLCVELLGVPTHQHLKRNVRVALEKSMMFFAFLWANQSGVTKSVTSVSLK